VPWAWSDGNAKAGELEDANDLSSASNRLIAFLDAFMAMLEVDPEEKTRKCQ
jgi:hypothetical protein